MQMCNTFGLEFVRHTQPLDMPRLSLSSIDVSQETADWFQIITSLGERSKREFVRQLIEGHFVRWRRRHIEQVQYFANRYEMGWEQAYMLLADVDRKPPYSASDLEWARDIPTDEFWITKESALNAAAPSPNTDSYQEDRK